jgi:hypothetical protein
MTLQTVHFLYMLALGRRFRTLLGSVVKVPEAESRFSVCPITRLNTASKSCPGRPSSRWSIREALARTTTNLCPFTVSNQLRYSDGRVLCFARPAAYAVSTLR